MKFHIPGALVWLASAICCTAEPAPADLNGAVLVLDYSAAEFCTETATTGNSGWVSLQQITGPRRDVAAVFHAASVPPKSSRRLLPITADGQGGTYTYRCKGGNLGEIDVDMQQTQQVGVLRIITLQFTSPTTAEAIEGIYHGSAIATVRHIKATIQPPTRSTDDGLLTLRRELEKKRYITPLQRLYRTRLLQLLQRIEAGEGVNITYPQGKGSTALHLACDLGYTEMVSWLLAHGADVHARTDSGITPADCVAGPDAAAIRRLLNTAAKRHSKATAQPPTRSTDNELLTLRRELEKKQYDTPLQRLYRTRLLQLLQRIEAGEGVNITYPQGKGSTALHLACELSHTELVSWLLAHGADVHARTDSGITPADCVSGPNAAAIRRLLNRAAAGK